MTCPYCEGEGVIFGIECRYCDGQGEVYPADDYPWDEEEE
jgi:DnaJ-class molecular chaperone